MTAKEKQELTNYRRQGLGYKKIAQLMGLSENTVKTYCKRNNLGGSITNNNAGGKKSVCKLCGTPLVQTPGRKARVFCCDACRNNWWNSHANQLQHRDGRQIPCGNCGRILDVSKNSSRKYCSHTCYVADRFYGGAAQ